MIPSVAAFYPHVSITETNGQTMNQTLKTAAIAAMYQEAHDRLIAASLVLREVVEAAEAGQMNLARGTALEAELSLDEAVKLMGCAAVLHGLRG